MAFEYDASASYLWTALQVSHTVVPSVISRPTFWFFFAIHIGVVVTFHCGLLETARDPQSLLYIDWKIVSVITSMTTFFEVFYTNNVFSRYLNLYQWTRSIIGTLSNFAFDMRVHAGEHHQPLVRLSTRFLMASVFLFFYELNGTVSELEWRSLASNKLLYDEEIVVLKKFHGHQSSMVVLHWAGRVVKETVRVASAPNNIVKGLIDRLVEVREKQQRIKDTLLLPMPFQYFHLLNMMVVVNLVLWAYGMGVTESIFAPAGFFFAELIFCGMMELAGQMTDPFGRDEVDFPLHVWLADALWDTAVVLEYHYDIGAEGWEQVAASFPALDMNQRRVSQVWEASLDDDARSMKVVDDYHNVSHQLTINQRLGGSRYMPLTVMDEACVEKAGHN